MVRKVDAAKLQNLNLKVKTLDLKPYTDRWKPEAVTSEVFQKWKSLGILKLYYKTTRFRFQNMLRKVDTAKL